MITKLTTVEELKQIFVENLLNNTDKVTKISEGSVLNGVAYGIAKISQKIIKDVAILEAHIYPDSASGIYLDNIAKLRGISARYTTSGSSTYVRVVGEVGTTYVENVHRFIGNGIEFVIDETVSIGDEGFNYVKVRSLNKGLQTNVSPLAINKVMPAPAGHLYCINEYQSVGGRDNEDDELFRKRIKDERNIVAKSTVSYLEQVFRMINPEVLNVYIEGRDVNSNIIIGISRVSGGNFLEVEIEEIYYKLEQYLSVNEFRPDGLYGYGIVIKNLEYFPIDVSMRIDFDSSMNVDIIRRDIQININKLLDWRYWSNGRAVRWIDLIDVVKNTKGVKRVIDNYFFPNADIIIPKNHIPRIRGFVLMNMEGTIVVDLPLKLNPNFYPAVNDFDYQSTVLRNL